MKIIVAQRAGFCFGVQRAIDIIEKVVGTADIFTVGPIIHNPAVVSDLEKRGVCPVNSVDEIPPGATVVIRSHGMSPSQLKEIALRGAKIIDATCPLVKRAQERAAELADKKYKVVIIGEKSHPEVIALKGCAPESIVVESPDEIPANLANERVGAVVQTTQTAENFVAIVSGIAGRAPAELRVFNTICSATAERQNEVRQLAEEVDVVFVLGGRNSANTTRLTNIAGKVGTKTFHLESADELKAEMIAGAERVGITAGASTPRWIIDSFVETLETLEGKTV